jgi:hypothetical protein
VRVAVSSSEMNSPIIGSSNIWLYGTAVEYDPLKRSVAVIIAGTIIDVYWIYVYRYIDSISPWKYLRVLQSDVNELPKPGK